MDNCCDRRLRTFVKNPSEKLTTYMFKRKGGGVKGFLKKKLHFSYQEASLTHLPICWTTELRLKIFHIWKQNLDWSRIADEGARHSEALKIVWYKLKCNSWCLSWSIFTWGGMLQTAVLTLFGIHSTKKAEFFVCMSSICWSTWYPMVSCILKQG